MKQDDVQNNIGYSSVQNPLYRDSAEFDDDWPGYHPELIKQYEHDVLN